MLVDSHCHLDFPDFASELDAVVARAQAAGVGRIVTISTRVKRHAQVLAIAERFPNVTCSVGTHPHHAHEEFDITADAAKNELETVVHSTIVLGANRSSPAHLPEQSLLSLFGERAHLGHLSSRGGCAR